MATTTTKLALTKPDLTDPRDIRVLNTNFDVIDKALTGNSNGQLTVTVSGTPTITMGAAAGTSPPAAVLGTGSNDSRGNFTFGTGTATTTGAVLTVTFANAFPTAVRAVIITPTTGATSANAPQFFPTNLGTTSWQLFCNVAPTASQGNTVYGFCYTVVA